MNIADGLILGLAIVNFVLMMLIINDALSYREALRQIFSHPEQAEQIALEALNK